MTLKKLSLLLSLTSILYWTDSSPLDLGSLEFDNLDTDVSDLKYEPENGDLEDFFKPVGSSVDKKTATEDTGKNQSKLNIGASGSKKKTADRKGLNILYNIEDIKKFLKQAGLHDAGSYDDGASYAAAKEMAAAGFGIAGNEDRKYKKGIKSKGFHRVSHKDEYNNNKEFYVDDETSGVIKKIGAKGQGFGTNVGAGLRKGYYHHDLDKGLFAKEGLSDKGKLNKEYNGYSDSQGFDEYFNLNK